MATRSLVEASIDSFWNEAGVPRPPSPRGPKRQQPAKLKAGIVVNPKLRLPPSPGVDKPRARQTDRGYPAPSSVTEGSRRGTCNASTSAGPPRSRVADRDWQEFRNVAVELAGREGYNAAAVNGTWIFWNVKNGRLAFRREVLVDIGEEEKSDTLHEPGSVSNAPNPDDVALSSPARVAQTAVRLFLVYVQKTDTWIISDSADSTGCVVADCGPVGKADDLDQNWRVWDGEGWKEDRNITARILVDDSLPQRLSGLRVVPHGSTQANPLTSRDRAKSQDGRHANTTPLTARADFMRALTPRQLDSVAPR